MDADSARMTLGYAPHLTPASLSGYRTAWNVAARINEGKNMSRIARYADGISYEGLIVPIGLEEGSNYSATGMVFQAQEDDLALLDEREVNYDRVDVTEHIEWIAEAAPKEPYRVYTYVPKPASVAMLYDAASTGMKAVVTKSYLDTLYRVAERYHYETPLVIPVPQWQVHDIYLHPATSGRTALASRK